MAHKKTFPNGTKLEISQNRHFLQFSTGAPFFWLADTGWLLYQKLTLDETSAYLDNRKAKGFNVIMTMMQNSPKDKNILGQYALKNGSLTETFCGITPEQCGVYDYWNHISRVIDMAAERGLFIALLPVWGSFVNSGCLTKENAEDFTTWIVNKYREKQNIIWVLGGDIKGDIGKEIWNQMGQTIRKYDKEHLISYHPFGRTSSSQWFHNEEWLDFHMFQSGHRYYDQIMKHGEEPDENLEIGPDNWRYVGEDLRLMPPKPTMDGEPSYEGIPYGLHDASLPRWNARDARRYAYWSVLAGSCGHTYGHNAVMQMHNPRVEIGAYGAGEYWKEALDSEAAGQMKFLKELILSLPYYDRVPALDLIEKGDGERYEKILASRGSDYLVVYWYKKRSISLNLSFLNSTSIKLWWIDPVSGSCIFEGERARKPILTIAPPNQFSEDALLVIRDSSCNFTYLHRDKI